MLFYYKLGLGYTKYIIIQPSLDALAARINSDSKAATSLTTRKLTIKTHNIIILYYECDMSTVKAVGRRDRGPIGFDSGPDIILYAFKASFFRRSYQFGYNKYIYNTDPRTCSEEPIKSKIPMSIANTVKHIPTQAEYNT